MTSFPPVLTHGTFLFFIDGKPNYIYLRDKAFDFRNSPLHFVYL